MPSPALRITPRPRFAVIASTMCVIVWCGTTDAAAPPRVAVRATGSCPTASDVAHELKRSLPDSTVATDGAASAEPHESIELIDLGSRYAVRAAGTERFIDEPARDCAERARVAAVFAAVALDPPFIDEPTARRPSAANDERGSVAPRSSSDAVEPATGSGNVPEPLQTWLSLGLIGTWADSAAQPFATGPEFSIGVAKGLLAVRATVAVTTPITVSFDDASAEIVRVPASVSAYVRARTERTDVGIGLGLAVDALNLSGRGAVAPENETRLQVGARASAYGRLVLGDRWGLFSELAGTFVPSTYDIEVAPAGVVGNTPAVWLALTLGGTMTLD